MESLCASNNAASDPVADEGFDALHDFFLSNVSVGE